MSGLRIVAGVLIIVIAVLDLISCFGYLFVGGVASAVGEAGRELSTFGPKTDPGAKALAGASQAVGLIGTTATMFGLFLLVLFGLGIACGIVLFMEKAPIFAIVVGSLQILADLVAGITIYMGVTNLLAIAVGIVVIFAGTTYLKKPGAPPLPQVPPPL